MRHMARRAGIHADSRISTRMRVGRNLVGSCLMDAVHESGQRIYLSLHYPVRIVTRQAHLRVRTVAHQKVLSDFVDVLNVRIVATRAGQPIPSAPLACGTQQRFVLTGRAATTAGTALVTGMAV